MDLDHEEHEDHEETLYGFLPSISLRALLVLCGGRNHLLRASTVLTLIALAACGGNNGGSAEVTVRSTLTYVVTECREDAHASSGHQKLVIRQGEREVTVREFAATQLPAVGLCPLFAEAREGGGSVIALPFQRLGISWDGSAIGFEVTDDNSILAPILPHGLLPPGEEEGIFVVQADGSGLRRVGPASREPTYRFSYDPSSPTGAYADYNHGLAFSPDGQRIAFTDKGPDGTGQEAPQVVTLDLRTGTRIQVTHLPPLAPLVPSRLTVFVAGWFSDGETLGFWTSSTPGGLIFYMVKADGLSAPVPNNAPAAVPGSPFVPEPSITAAATGLFLRSQPGTAVNHIPGFQSIISELFVSRADDVLQLTNFHRSDTGYYGAMLDQDEQRVLFAASADPFGTNPNENCQFFSIDTLGGDLRQLTQFGKGGRSLGGCTASYRPGCRIAGIAWEPNPGPDTITFYSSCDPLGTNPDGGQFFAISADGTSLHQLTQARGAVTEADGTVTTELLGPWTHAAVVQRVRR
jgi:hypothetical protein